MDKALSLLSLSIKAGRYVSGEAPCENAIKSGKAKLLIVAEDASGNTQKKVSDACNYHHIPKINLGTKEELGKLTNRASTALVAVTDEGFAAAILKKID